jgi:hypothetical protein
MKRVFSAAALLLAPRIAGACAICFGGLDNKSGLAQGFWWAVVLLILITMSLLAGIGWTLWTVERDRAARDA